MAKDSKGHGSEPKTHQQFAELGMRLHKESGQLHKAGKRSEAVQARAKANEAMTMANHLRKSEQRTALGATPAQKMGVARTNKDGSTFSVGAKLPRWGAHSTHGPEAATGRVRATTQNKKY